MPDKFRRYLHYNCGVGGFRCYCCNDFKGKTKRQLNKIARTQLKEEDKRRLIEDYKHDVFEEDFREEVDEAMHEAFDDGWRICEYCGEGFTLWYEQIALCDIGKTEPTNGYCEDRDASLCDKCFKEE